MTSKSEVWTSAQFVEVVVVPVRIGRAADVHVGAVVGHDEAVFLEGVEDYLIVGGVAGDVEAGFQAEAHAHGRGESVGGIGGPVRGWWDEGFAAVVAA